MLKALRIKGGYAGAEVEEEGNILFNGEGKIGAYFPLGGNAYAFGCLKNLDGKFYFGAMGTADKNRDPYIFKYDPTSNRIEQVFRVQMGTVTWDTHRVPTIEHDASGNIYVCAELLRTPANGLHGADIKLYKTTVPYDISTLSLYKTLTGRWSYAQVFRHGNNMTIGARGSTNTTNFIRGQFWYYDSSDLGANFGSAVQMYTSGDENIVAYIWRMHDPSGVVHYIYNERNNTLINWTFVAHWKRTIGSNVVSNASGSFTKNVSSSGALTRAEVLANCVILESANYNTKAVQYSGGIVKENGDIKVIIMMQTLTGDDFEGNPVTTLDEVRYYYFTGGVWAYNNITVPPSLPVDWIYIGIFSPIGNNDAFDDITYIDHATRNMYIRHSSNNFSTYTEELILEGNENYRYGVAAYNVEEQSDYFLALLDPQGDPYEIQFETLADYNNILTLKV